MKYLIFLLLLSANCLGQLSVNRTIIGYDEDSLRVYKNIQGGMRDATVPFKHVHKWVELHQDTVQHVSAWITFGMPAGYQVGVNLICLKCQEEKRQIINYGENPNKVLFNKVDSLQIIGGTYSGGRIGKKKVIHYKRDK